MSEVSTRPREAGFSRRSLWGGRQRPKSHETRRQVQPLRSAERHRQRVRATEKSNAGSVPPLAVIALNRMGFGPRPGDLEAFDTLGATDEARLQAYVDQQLDPASIDDSALDTRLAAAGYTTLGKGAAQLWADHVTPDPPWEVRMRPVAESERAVFLRAVHSRRQLVEVLADFWHNHFNVYAWEYSTGPLWVSYDRDVIRGHMLGNFRAFLEAVATSVPMLYYLDNYTNSNGGPNENYARELCELHGFGAENYLGVLRQNLVPEENGVPVGYVDDDVYEATRAFTGWTIDWDTGQFMYRVDWHDRFQKNVLGVFLPADQPDLRDGRDVLDAIAAHPGTARFIARKLCRRLIADEPPQSVVDAAAAVFSAQQAAPDQLAQVVRTILLSPELATTWGEKVKRPFELAVSALRATGAELDLRLGHGTSDTFMWLYGQTGQLPFRWRPPNGYPDFKEDWLSTTPLLMSWRLINWLVDETDGSVTGNPHIIDAVGQTPVHVRTATELVDFWSQRLLGRALCAAERQEVLDFMAAGRNPDLDLPVTTDEDVQERLRSMLGLLLISPEFLLR